MSDREEINNDPQVIQILGTNCSCRSRCLVDSMWVVIVSDDEQTSTPKVGCLGREYLVCAKEHIRHGHGFFRRDQHLGFVFPILGKGLQGTDIIGTRDVEIHEEVAVGVSQATSTIRVILELGLVGAKEQNTHHVLGLGYDALLHKVISAFQRRLDRAVSVRLL